MRKPATWTIISLLTATGAGCIAGPEEEETTG